MGKFYENRFSLITVREKNEESMNEKIIQRGTFASDYLVIWGLFGVFVKREALFEIFLLLRIGVF